MFERFTKEARNAVTAAVAEAEQRDTSRVGTEHLLLGVIATGSAHLSQLASLGLTEEVLRHELDEMERRALGSVGIDPQLIESETSAPKTRTRRRHRPFTGAAKNMLKDAAREAEGLGHRHIGGAHIVLAMTTLPPQDRVTRLLDAVGPGSSELRRSLLTSMRGVS